MLTYLAGLILRNIESMNIEIVILKQPTCTDTVEESPPGLIQNYSKRRL